MKKEDLKNQASEETSITIPLVRCENKQEERIVCPVCGHPNPEFTAICKMCSNYLI